jgi:hypothetical protein
MAYRNTHTLHPIFMVNGKIGWRLTSIKDQKKDLGFYKGWPAAREALQATNRGKLIPDSNLRLKEPDQDR